MTCFNTDSEHAREESFKSETTLVDPYLRFLGSDNRGVRPCGPLRLFARAFRDPRTEARP